jgi:hypothetical protein
MELNQEFINLKLVESHIMRRHKGSRNLQLARVCVDYYNLVIYGYLMRGDNSDGHYYYFEMPNIILKGKPNQKDKILNRAKFENKADSDFFQSVVLKKLHDSHPHFFEVDYGKE